MKQSHRPSKVRTNAMSNILTLRVDDTDQVLNVRP
jgi:hypothetical protein